MLLARTTAATANTKMSPSPVDRRRFGSSRERDLRMINIGRPSQQVAFDRPGQAPVESQNFLPSASELPRRAAVFPFREGKVGAPPPPSARGSRSRGRKRQRRRRDCWLALLRGKAVDLSADLCGDVRFFALISEVRRASRSRKGNAPRRAASSQRARIFLGVRASCDVTVACTRKVAGSD